MAKPIRAEDPEEFAKLEKDVIRYIEKNPYPGFEKSFELEKLVLQPADGTTRLVKAHFKDSSLKIDKMDRKWLEDLKHLGDYYGVRVVIDERHYLR